MYIWTTLLGFSEESFWKSTPKKLNALYEIHCEVNGIKNEEEKGYIDDIIF
ncbi:hypothetical protein IAI10_20215 [Clostridium sp. 19966]|uniref:hypothetical protein n=1 Tax=Clostridium sp. 19966 TaxID=2768166 RepID=UPI0028DF170D|nr:hypothetical protein [Clostridium sp. 19966]MDT8718982.1 hypothetical protein [Clostridium sp. 19966]